MMATTHALVGAALAAVSLLVAPATASVAIAAGFLGGLFPDLDLYAGHRRTLHFPVYYGVAALGAVGVAAAWTGPVTVAVACFLVGAAAHAAMDVLGGGLELRPWQGQSERAVYSHFHGRWLRPRRWVPYDGAPGDLALAAGAGLVVATLGQPPVDHLAAAALVVSMGYALLRKRLAAIAERLATVLPAPVRPYVPDRYL